MYYIYILKSKKDKKKLYIGFTNDLRRRLTEHNNGESRYTKSFLPWVLVYYESYFSKKDASAREKQFKKYAKAWGQLKKRIRNSLSES